MINCISARLAPHILSLKDEYTSHFLNFLVNPVTDSLVKSEGQYFSESELELMSVLVRVEKISDRACVATDLLSENL